MTPKLPERLEALIKAYGNAMYDCGDWNELGEDREPYDDYCKTSEIAQAELVAAIALALSETGTLSSTANVDKACVSTVAGETPRTDAAQGQGRFANCVDVDFARQLERELNNALRGYHASNEDWRKAEDELQTLRDVLKRTDERYEAFYKDYIPPASVSATATSGQTFRDRFMELLCDHYWDSLYPHSELILKHIESVLDAMSRTDSTRSPK